MQVINSLLVVHCFWINVFKEELSRTAPISEWRFLDFFASPLLIVVQCSRIRKRKITTSFSSLAIPFGHRYDRILYDSIR